MAKELRTDITGLRAIAVVAVTIYHLMHVFLPEYEFFHGGFLGVDIFFVISGYLMTMIIIKGLDKGNFSLYDFYSRRAKRICPALFVTILVFVGLGYFLIGSGDLKRMASEGFSALLFVSNMYFAAKTDYFGNSALDLVFLHTWSLSVEWQFYLFYPVIIMGLRRYLDPKLLPRAILLLTAVSAIFAAYYTDNFPRSSYYILPSRAFELLIGGLAYFYPLSFFQNVFKPQNHLEGERKFIEENTTTAALHNQKLDQFFNSIKPWMVELLGLIIIAISLVVVNDQRGWPTLWALLPLFGTYLCIAANNKNSLLRNVVFQKLGLWSYAIYLVHWPLIVFVTKLGFDAWCLELLIPIMILGLLLHYGVERRRNYGYIFLGCYALVCGATYFVAQNGAKYRLDHEVTRYAQYGGHSIPFDGEIFPIGDTSRKPDFILVGDSFSRHYALDLIDRGLHVITVFRDGCYSFANNVNRRTEGHIDEKCALRYSNAKEAARQYPDIPIVVAQDWPRYEGSLVSREGVRAFRDESFYNAIRADIRSLAKDFAGRKVYVVATPRQTVFDIGSTCMYLHALENPLAKFIRGHFTCIKNKRLDDIPFNERLEDMIERLPQNRNKSEYDKPITYIDPNEAYCIDGRCEVLVGKFIPVYQDGLHFSWAGSIKVVSYVLSRIGVEQGRVRTEFEDEVVDNKKQGDSTTEEGYADDDDHEAVTAELQIEAANDARAEQAQQQEQQQKQAEQQGQKAEQAKQVGQAK